MSHGPRTPSRCTTIELKDLADTLEFENNGEIGTVYGFEFTDTGFYKRREIDDKQLPKLEQLKNVTAEIDPSDYEYKITKVQKKWHFTPIIEWDIKFEFISPYTLFDSERRFRKALNVGPLHVSLIPNTGGAIDVKPYKRQYLLSGQEDSSLMFIPEIPFDDLYTLLLKLSVKDGSLSNGGAKQTLMDGIELKWDTIEKEDQIVHVVIQKDANNTRGVTSLENVELTFKPNEVVGLKSINITHFDLIALYYVKTVLPQKIMKNLGNIFD